MDSDSDDRPIAAATRKRVMSLSRRSARKRSDRASSAPDWPPSLASTERAIGETLMKKRPLGGLFSDRDSRLSGLPTDLRLLIIGRYLRGIVPYVPPGRKHYTVNKPYPPGHRLDGVAFCIYLTSRHGDAFFVYRCREDSSFTIIVWPEYNIKSYRHKPRLFTVCNPPPMWNYDKLDAVEWERGSRILFYSKSLDGTRMYYFEGTLSLDDCVITMHPGEQRFRSSGVVPNNGLIFARNPASLVTVVENGVQLCGVQLAWSPIGAKFVVFEHHDRNICLLSPSGVVMCRKPSGLSAAVGSGSRTYGLAQDGAGNVCVYHATYSENEERGKRASFIWLSGTDLKPLCTLLRSKIVVEAGARIEERALQLDCFGRLCMMRQDRIKLFGVR